MAVCRPRLVGAALVVIAVLSGGCSTPDAHQPDDLWAADVAAAKNRASSDFERAVLGDGVITREEYAEAAQRFVDCMRSAGYQTVAVDDLGSGVFQYRTTQDPGAEEISQTIQDGCSAGTRDVIEPLYTAMLVNPTRSDINELVLKCLQRKGLAPEGMTVTEFAAIYWDDNAVTPWDKADDRVTLCTINPSLG